jgi:pimeloyl-ACP methyl ester carboxylesterase
MLYPVRILLFTRFGTQSTDRQMQLTRSDMPIPQSKSGFVNIDNAKIYYEIAGEGMPLVMIHAGVADSRQWNNEFAAFSQSYQVIRYDMRGYGKSEPADGEYTHLRDLSSLLDSLGIDEPCAMMGCSMGGGLAMDFTLMHPSSVKGLIMVDAGPGGLELDVPAPAKFADADKAFEAGNLDLVADIETQIWFDGLDRTPQQVNQAMRELLYEMDRLALSHEVKQLGKRLPNTEIPAVDRLEDLVIPVLIIVGSHDTPYMLAAANYMEDKIRFARKVVIEDAAHLPNMDHPDKFQEIVKDFLESLSS